MTDEAEQNTGTGREYEVGKGKPPKAHRFQPGNQEGKKAHKRNGFHLKTLLQKKLAEVSPDGRRTFAELFIEQELKRAVQKGGDSGKRVWEYIEGRPLQPVDVTSGGEALTRITISYSEAAPDDGDGTDTP